MQDKFELPVGYSGHEQVYMPSLIAAFGAKAIERHISLDRAMYGSDQAASLGPEGHLLIKLENMKKLLEMG